MAVEGFQVQCMKAIMINVDPDFHVQDKPVMCSSVCLSPFQTVVEQPSTQPPSHL